MAEPPRTQASVANLERKALWLLAALATLIAAAALYLLYARGAFEPKQQVALLADDAEGIRVGTELSFSGFPIGRVRRIELTKEGTARIVVDVRQDEAHWLRESSVFTLNRNLVGGTSLRAYSGILTDPPLPDGAERKLLVGDASAELPKLVSQARELLANLTALTSSDGALAQSLANVQEATARLKGPQGAAGLVFGNEKDARKLVAAIDRANALLARLDGVAAKAGGLVGNADTQLFGADGVMPRTRAAVGELDAALVDARTALKHLDEVLGETKAIASNARGATTDLDLLRAEVDASLRKVEQLIDQVNRAWPFGRKAPEIRLP